jgi:hypothetical protein
MQWHAPLPAFFGLPFAPKAVSQQRLWSLWYFGVTDKESTIQFPQFMVRRQNHRK